MRARLTTEPTSTIPDHTHQRRAAIAVDEAQDLLARAGELDHHGQHMSVGELAAMENLYPEGEARLDSLRKALEAFTLSPEPWWVFQIGGISHRRRLWRFGNINGAKRLHVVNPPGYGSDQNRTALCGVVIEGWVDDRTTPICPRCKRIMEGGEE